MAEQAMPAWLQRFDELLKAPRGAQMIATETHDGAPVELQRLLLARHWLYYPDVSTSDDAVLWFLQIGWDNGPEPGAGELGEDYFGESRPRSVTTQRARIADNGDVLFSIPVGEGEDPWSSTVEIQVTPCSEDNAWVVDDWDVYCQTLSSERFEQDYVQRITPGHPDGNDPWEPAFRG